MEHDAEHEPEAGPSSPRASPGVLDMSLDVVGDGELDEAEVLEVENNGMDEAGTIDYSSAAYPEESEADAGNGQPDIQNDALRIPSSEPSEEPPYIDPLVARFHRPFKLRHKPVPKDTPDKHANVALPNYKARFHLTGHRKAVSSIRFSPNGKWLATASGDGRILLFSLPPAQPETATSTSTSNGVAASSPPQFIRAYTIPPLEKPVVKVDVPLSSVPPVGSAGINDIVFSPDSSTLASAGDDKLVRLWTVNVGDVVAAASAGDYGQVNGHATARGANTTGTKRSKPAEGYNGDEAEEEVEDPYPDMWRNGQLPPSSTIPMGGNTSYSRSNAPLAVMRGHTSFVFCLAYSPRGNLLASGSYDETIRIWNIKKRKCLRTLPAHSDPVTSVAFSYDGSLLCSCGHDGLLRLWDASTGQCLRSLVGEANPPATFCTFTPNARYIICVTLDSTIKLWDFHAQQCVKTYVGHKNVKHQTPALFWIPEQARRMTATGPSGDGICIAAPSEDGKICFWDLQSRKMVRQLEGHEGAVLCLALEPKSGMLASASLDPQHTVKIWVRVGLASRSSESV